jgi:hypothetical protein
VKALVVLVLLAGTAFAESPPTPSPPPPQTAAPSERLAAAQARFGAGEYATAAAMAGPLTRDPDVPRAIRAEALRIYGLSLFFLELRADAEDALVAHLRLEPDAHLDPAQVPPEAIVFFEDVRARHAGAVAKARPRVRRFHSPWLALLPPWGQFQNGDRTKGWIIGVAEVVFLAANLTTFAMLSSMCSDADKTCTDPDNARALQTVNLVSGSLLIATVAYAVIDGLVGYRAPDPERGTLTIAPTSGGAAVVLTWGF